MPGILQRFLVLIQSRTRRVRFAVESGGLKRKLSRARLRVFWAALVCSLAIAATAAENYHARLSAVPADARTRPDLTGSGSVRASFSGAALTISGSFEGLKTPATTAKLHAAVAAGVRGPSFADVMVTRDVNGKLEGSFDLTPDQAAKLRKGGIYVVIQSEKAPDGALWGWLLREENSAHVK